MPLASNRPVACNPPVLAKVGWLSRPGSAASSARSTTGPRASGLLTAYRRAGYRPPLAEESLPQVAEARANEAHAQKAAADQRSKAVSLYNRWEQVDASARTMAQPHNLPVPPPMSEPSK